MKKEYDFSKAKRVDPKRVYSSAKVMISLRLDPNVTSALRDEAEALGIGYQTLISSILEKHVSPEITSIEDRIFNRILDRFEEAGITTKQPKAKSKKKKSA